MFLQGKRDSIALHGDGCVCFRILCGLHLAVDRQVCLNIAGVTPADDHQILAAPVGADQQFRIGGLHRIFGIPVSGIDTIVFPDSEVEEQGVDLLQ
ncbi:hypothetical protein SDC9_167571 [bioreactor metagenome]|uniref:Uncharacterized protein n=1 Tax=bioreactor metagenome TaxID=1076179 RepID=A0A645G8E5_9ZZZZ